MNTVIACSELSSVHELRKFDLAVPLLERGLACAREHEVNLLTSGVMGSLARAYGLTGRVADGHAMLDQFLGAVASGGLRASLAHVVVKIGELALAAGDLDRAERFATQALATSRDGGMRGWEADARLLLGDIAAHRRAPDLGAAERHYGAALAARRTRDAPARSALPARRRNGLSRDGAAARRQRRRWMRHAMLHEMRMARWYPEPAAD
jgi:hypothetical protein